jgi:hypothetical protein
MKAYKIIMVFEEVEVGTRGARAFVTRTYSLAL